MNPLPIEVFDLSWWLERDDVVCKNQNNEIVPKNSDEEILVYLETCQACGASLVKCACQNKTKTLTLVWDDTAAKGSELQEEAVLTIRQKSVAVTPVTTPVAATPSAPIVPPFKQRAMIMVNLGIPVIPLRVGEKSAFLPGWEELATTSLEQIDKWASDYPDANCGAVAYAKPDGVLFFEVDSKDVLERLLKETGKSIPDTFTVRSSPGKGHIYFRQTAAEYRCGQYFAGLRQAWGLESASGQAVCSFPRIVQEQDQLFL